MEFSAPNRPPNRMGGFLASGLLGDFTGTSPMIQALDQNLAILLACAWQRIIGRSFFEK
jgi:hypothetical protein